MSPRRSWRRALLALFIPLAIAAAPVVADELRDAREVHLGDVRQLTFGGENAEAYWSPDGKELIFQAAVEPYACDQIFRMPATETGERQLVSTGKGRTTCAYFFPSGERVLYASTHLSDSACPPRPDFSQGYVWPLYETYEMFTARPDGSDLKRLTENDAYDAEGTVCPLDGSILFTSTRDGDLDLYRMDADGGNVRRLTDMPGYDGGGFFSADCTKIVWRASRPEGEALEDYKRLLGEGLVRPGKLELWMAEADGSEPRQITYLDAASFAPYLHPSGKRILFSTNYGDPGGREFDIWAVDVDGTNLERITYSPGFDGFPMFSPDGQWLAFSSNRNQAEQGETNVFVARWHDDVPASGEAGEREPTAAERLRDAVAWMADDERQGRGIGSEGLAATADWLEAQLRNLGVAPGGADGSYRQRFEVPVSVSRGEGTLLTIDGETVASDAFAIASFSAAGAVEGEVVPVGHGISAPDRDHDDYEGHDMEGKIALVRRFMPEGPPFDGDDVPRRYGDLRYKAWNAREHGAVGVIIVDLPQVEEGAELPDEAPLPALRVDSRGDAGLPVVTVRRTLGASLLSGSHQARLVVDLNVERKPAENVIGKIAANGEASEGAVVVGAHYDHLGLGGPGSLAPDTEAPHNGADDNASGTAVLLEIARDLMSRRDSLRRDVYLVAFSGEESGLLGSTAFTQTPPPGMEIGDLMAMINLDMVGRLRRNRLSVLGTASAEEWPELVPVACDQAGLRCTLGGDGYGPSDQTPFYASGVPVLHLFTGAHGDYHKPSDDAEAINAAGLARIAALTADLAAVLAEREAPLSYRTAEAPEPQGETRSYGASMGTIPDYASEARGVLLAGVRPGGAAAEAGMQRGDLLVELAGHPVGDIYDFMYVLQKSKPGETVTAVVERDGERLSLPVTFGKSSRLRQ